MTSITPTEAEMTDAAISTTSISQPLLSTISTKLSDIMSVVSNSTTTSAEGPSILNQTSATTHADVSVFESLWNTTSTTLSEILTSASTELTTSTSLASSITSPVTPTTGATSHAGNVTVHLNETTTNIQETTTVIENTMSSMDSSSFSQYLWNTTSKALTEIISSVANISAPSIFTSSGVTGAATRTTGADYSTSHTGLVSAQASTEHSTPIGANITTTYLSTTTNVSMQPGSDKTFMTPFIAMVVIAGFLLLLVVILMVILCKRRGKTEVKTLKFQDIKRPSPFRRPTTDLEGQRDDHELIRRGSSPLAPNGNHAVSGEYRGSSELANTEVTFTSFQKGKKDAEPEKIEMDGVSNPSYEPIENDT